jgi:hypothetical protein
MTGGIHTSLNSPQGVVNTDYWAACQMRDCSVLWQISLFWRYTDWSGRGMINLSLSTLPFYCLKSSSCLAPSTLGMKGSQFASTFLTQCSASSVIGLDANNNSMHPMSCVAQTARVGMARHHVPTHLTVNCARARPIYLDKQAIHEFQVRDILSL